MTWPNDTQSSTPARYQFKLISDTETIICDNPPLEWRSCALEIKRDIEAGGVFSTFHADSLTFIGNGGDLLTKLFGAYQVNAKCTLVVSWWKEFDFVTPANGRQYIEFPSRFDINFVFFERVKIGRFYFGARIKAINSNTQTKLDNRQDVEVNLTGLTTIGGATIADTLQKKKLYYAATSVFYSVLFDVPGIVDYDLPHAYHKDSYTSVPLVINSNSIPETIQAVPYEANRLSLKVVTPFLKRSTYDHEFDVTPNILINVSNRYGGESQPYELLLYEIDSTGNPVSDADPYNLASFGKTTGNTYVNEPFKFTVRAGNSLILAVHAPGINSTYHASIRWIALELKESVSSSPAALTEGFPIYEAFERVGQHMLDTQYPIYSEFFGRTDVNYKEGVKYSSENQLRFAHVQGGLNIRGAKLTDDNVQLSVSFKDLFKSMKALYNIGYALETLPGETTQRIRIEEYAHFFENTELVFTPSIQSRLNKYDIQLQIMPELIPVDIKSGYDNFEYLSLNGLGEPNTTNQRTSIMNTATKWENISPYRADTKGIMDNLSNPIDTKGTEDTKGDNAIFIIKTQKATAPVNSEDWIPEKDTNVQIVSGSLFKEELLNRYFTPTRMLLRHGNRLAAGMKLYSSSKLKFQKTDKWSTLQTSGAGFDNLIENQDITVSQLGNPIYTAIKYHAVIPGWTFSDTQALQSHPFRYIKFSDTVSGYLLSFTKKNGEDRAEITLIERYVP